MTERTNAIIDLSHHNEHVDLAEAQTDGILGVIHKATQGLNYTDKMYAVRRTQAKELGLLWGAYHFGVDADGSDQADYFLKMAQPDDSTLLVIDYEPDPVGPTMTLDQCREFVRHIVSVTGRYPVLYSGSLIKEQLGHQVAPDPVLRKCPLWVAEYVGPEPLNVPPTFATWALWQYTDGVHGPEPHSVQGVGLCDRDVFNGSQEELVRFWTGAVV